MSVASLPRRGFGALVAAITLALTPLAFAPPASAGEVDGPGFQQPALGECRALTLSEMNTASDRTAPTDCADPHTMLVIAVPRLPQSMSWSAPRARLVAAFFKKCRPALDEFLGRTEGARKMSAYSFAWYMPTKSQRDHGARWFRCDAILYGGTKALNLPDDTAPALNQTPLPDSVARCLTGKLFLTACSRSHAWRATGNFRMRGDTYPSAKKFQAASVRCESRVSSSGYRYQYPRLAEWKLGDRTMLCYSKTTS
jgi:hypothetical protein